MQDRSPLTRRNLLATHGRTIQSGQMDMADITGGSPYGASTIAGADGSRQPSDSELAGARFQGRHVADIANKLRRA